MSNRETAKAEILDTLKKVIDPDLGRDFFQCGWRDDPDRRVIVLTCK